MLIKGCFEIPEKDATLQKSSLTTGGAILAHRLESFPSFAAPAPPSETVPATAASALSQQAIKSLSNLQRADKR